jgi:hypothetical protein
VGGHTDSVYFKNKVGGFNITPSDTMHLFLHTTSSVATDTLASLLVDIAFNPGDTLNSHTDDHFYSLHIVSQKRRVFERDGEFTFTPSQPVPYGQKPQSGTFSASVTFSNDKTATLVGSFSPTGYQATYTGPDGVTKTIQYSTTGVVVSEN